MIQLIRQAPPLNPNEPVQPSEANAWDNRGFAYYRKGDYAQATQDFGRAIELFQAPHGWLWSGRLSWPADFLV